MSFRLFRGFCALFGPIGSKQGAKTQDYCQIDFRVRLRHFSSKCCTLSVRCCFFCRRHDFSDSGLHLWPTQKKKPEIRVSSRKGGQVPGFKGVPNVPPWGGGRIHLDLHSPGIPDGRSPMDSYFHLGIQMHVRMLTRTRKHTHIRIYALSLVIMCTCMPVYVMAGSLLPAPEKGFSGRVCMVCWWSTWEPEVMCRLSGLGRTYKGGQRSGKSMTPQLGSPGKAGACGGHASAYRTNIF